MAFRDSTETERKYDPSQTARVPVFAGIAGVEQSGEPTEMFLEAVYYDTAGLELAARGITLRRRTGGTDQGWHLKLPIGPDSRREIQAPLGQPDHVPAELLDQLAVLTRGHNLSPVARLSTRRNTYRLHGPDGLHLADFTDDRVHAVILPGPGTEKHWREWDLKLVHATPELITAAHPALEAAGAVPSAHTSKLARALGTSWPEAPAAAPGPARKKGPARDVVTAYVSVQINELLTHDAGVRQGLPDSLHQMNSAARRTRSVLRTYRTLFTRGALVGLERDLQWLGRILGRPRDAEVMSGKILANLHALPEAQASGPARGQLEHELDTAYSTGYQHALATLNSPRYYRILTALEHFRDNPPAKSKASKPARKNQRSAGEPRRPPVGPRPQGRQKSSRNRRIRRRAPSGLQRRRTPESRRRIRHSHPRETGTCAGKNRPQDPRRSRRPPEHRSRPRTPAPARRGTGHGCRNRRRLHSPDQPGSRNGGKN